MSTIVLVDDNEDLVKIFSLFLSRQGHTVHSAPGGRECLEMLATVAPDIILLDIMMPGMDGWETLLAIKQDPATRSLPISICSGKLPDMSMKEIDRYGNFIEEYLVKPQDLSRLSTTIAHIVQRHRDHEKMREYLKHEFPDHRLIDEFIDCQKKIYILEKISRFFTADPEKSGWSIERNTARMNEIRNSLHHQVLPVTLDPQAGIWNMHPGAGTTVDNGIMGPGIVPEEWRESNRSGHSNRSTQ